METESQTTDSATRPGPKWLAIFRRVTSSGRFIPEIDGLRFVAIFLVYLFHCREYFLLKGSPYTGDASASLAARSLAHGNYGVPLFFIISGFVLALPFASHHLCGSKRVSLRSYYLRRLTRLEPPYALSLLLLFVLSVVYLHRDASELLPHLAAGLVYLHSLIYGTLNVISPVAWSLEVEIQFYILVPFLAGIFAIKSTSWRRLTIVALIASAIVFQRVWMPTDVSRLTLTILSQLQFFLLGFLLADIYLVDWRSAPTQIRAWDLVSLIFWPLLPVLWERPELSAWLFPPIALMLYCAAFRGKWSRRVFSNPWITTIGGMCYTIYLLHYPIISFVGRHTIKFRMTNDFNGELLWQVTLVTPFVLVVCGAYFYLIEKPCMRSDWPKRMAAKLRFLGHGTITPAELS